MKHSFRLTVMVIGMLALTLALPGFVEGKSSGGGMRMPGGGGKGKSNSNNNNSSLSSVQTAQPESPEIVAARKTLADDKEALDAAVAKVWGPFSQTQAYLDAETAFNAASVNLKAAQAAMIAKLADSDDYKQAVKDRDDAKAAMQSAGSSSSDDNGGSNATASFADNEAKYLDAKAKIAKMEQDAAANDPVVKAAQAKYDEAKKAVDAQTALFQDTLAADAGYKAAKKAYDDADANLQTLLAAAKSKQPAKPAPAAATPKPAAPAPAAPAAAAPAAAPAVPAPAAAQ